MLDINLHFNHMNKFGNIEECYIVDNFAKDDKNYVIYKSSDSGYLYADLYEIVDDKLKIIPITKEEDYDIVDRYLESL